VPDNTFLPDPLRTHCRLVDLVAGAGAEPPTGWVALRQRWNDFLALDRRTINDTSNPTPLHDKLIGAVVDGAPDADIPAMRALAHAEEQIGGGKVTSRVQAAVLARLTEIYGGVALDNYGRVATQFNDCASKFGAAGAQADVEADGEAMVDQPDKARKAWLDGQKYAHHITRLMGALHAAAQLAGVPDAAKKHEGGGGRDAMLIPLCTNVSDQHRRVVWEAWAATEGRCGRWAALHKAGVPIRALPADQLADFEGYRPPKPLQERWIPVAPLGTSVRHIFDPEDPEPPKLPEPAKFGRLAP
jgi:hypothetical protein